MLSKNKKQLLLQLRQKKFRQKYNKFIVEGEKIAVEVLKQQEYSISELICTETWLEQHKLLLSSHPFQVHTATPKDMKEISTLTTAPEVILIMNIKSYPPEQLEKNTTQLSSPVILYLDGIQDPGNMGSILRIADWFGITAVYCSDECVDCHNSKVVQSGMGAFLRVRTEELTLEQLLLRYPDAPVYGATMSGDNIFNTQLRRGILVIGNEGNGISPENEKLITRMISIPGRGGAESLNAAIATGILVSRFFEKME